MSNLKLFWINLFKIEENLTNIVLLRGICTFSTIYESYYFGDRTKWIRTKRGSPVFWFTQLFKTEKIILRNLLVFFQLTNIGEKIRRFVFGKFVKSCHEFDNSNVWQMWWTISSSGQFAATHEKKLYEKKWARKS